MNYAKPKGLKYTATEFIDRDCLQFQVGESMFLLQNDTQPGGPRFYTLSSRDEGDFGEFKQVTDSLWHFIDQRCLTGELPAVLIQLPRGTAAYTDLWTYTTRDGNGQDFNNDIDLPMVLQSHIVAFAYAAAIEIALFGQKETA